MVEALFNLLRSWGLLKEDRQEQIQKVTEEKGLVVMVANDLIDLFTVVNNCTRSGDQAGRKVALTEILVRFGDDLEITADPIDRSSIRIRPRQSRFSAMTIVKLKELDPEVSRLALNRMLRRTSKASVPQAKVSSLPKARLS
ncbi:MAG: hypothetical protein H7Y37_11720 [Anaerolineae bacterium]|nr:hypothetical protein [Gloeobacterales cyanobacterium ES-bin-313]